MKKRITTESKAQLARRHMISRPMVSKYGSLGMPVLPDGRIDPKQADAWIAANIDRREGASSSGNLTEARTRKENALAGIRELELKKRKEELLEKSQVAAEWGKLLSTFRNRMLYIPSRISQKIGSVTDDRERRAIIEHEIKEALKTLSAYDPEKEG
jgi:hypothetical protein